MAREGREFLREFWIEEDDLGFIKHALTASITTSACKVKPYPQCFPFWFTAECYVVSFGTKLHQCYMSYRKCVCLIAKTLVTTWESGHSFAKVLWFISFSSSLRAFRTVAWFHCSDGRSSNLAKLYPQMQNYSSIHSDHLQFLINKASQQYHYHGDTRKQNLDDTQWLSSSHLVNVFISSAFRSKLQSVGMQGLIEQIKVYLGLSPGYLTYQQGFFYSPSSEMKNFLIENFNVILLIKAKCNE